MPSYVYRDQLASVRGIVSGTQTLSKQTLYKPFGMAADVVADPSETRGFINEHFDPEAGLQYLGRALLRPRTGPLPPTRLARPE